MNIWICKATCNKIKVRHFSLKCSHANIKVEYKVHESENCAKEHYLNIPHLFYTTAETWILGLRPLGRLKYIDLVETWWSGPQRFTPQSGDQHGDNLKCLSVFGTQAKSFLKGTDYTDSKAQGAQDLIICIYV